MATALQRKYLTSYDGTELCYHTGGSGPAVVLANGLGGPLASYRHIIEQLQCDYKILTWDYRGLYGSGRPPDVSDVGMDHHLRDMELLMEVEGIDHAIVVGWSMGVQVGFEFYRRHPEQVAGLFMLCGVAGSPFRTVPGAPVAGSAIPTLMNLGKRRAKSISQIAGMVTRWKGLVPLLQRAGVVAPSLDMNIFRDIATEFASLDVEVYCETLKQLGDHDAYSVLPEIRVPTLLLAGTKDVMTPRSVSERMHRAIDDCRLVVVEGGTHYTPVEFPDRVGDALDSFLEEIAGFEPARSRKNYA